MATPTIDIISQEHPASERIAELESAVNVELSDEEEGADADDVSHKVEQINQAQASGSKKKKKKKSKAKKIIDALSSTNTVPQAVLEKVVEQVKEDGAPGSESIDTEDVRRVLQQIKISDVLKGKATISGNNRKDVGEHKVCFSACWDSLTPYFVFSSGALSPYRNWV